LESKMNDKAEPERGEVINERCCRDGDSAVVRSDPPLRSGLGQSSMKRT